VTSRKPALLLLLPGLLLLVVGFAVPSLAMLFAPPGVTAGEILERLGRMPSASV
jgi:putative spermidine/putrescine transport system permease protein